MLLVVPLGAPSVLFANTACMSPSGAMANPVLPFDDKNDLVPLSSSSAMSFGVTAQPFRKSVSLACCRAKQKTALSLELSCSSMLTMPRCFSICCDLGLNRTTPGSDRSPHLFVSGPTEIPLSILLPSSPVRTPVPAVPCN